MTELFRLGFVARVSIILAGSLVFIQILMVMGLYIQRASNTGGSLSLPLADQVSAAAVLLGKGSAEERATLLRALNGTQFHVSVVSSPPVPEKNWRKMLLTMKQAFQESVAPSGRNVSIYIHKQHRWLVEGWLPSSKFTVVAQLQSGEYMVMEGSGAFAAIFGFPPGFWAGIMGFGVAILAIIVIRREARPLRRLADAADRLDPSEPRPIADSPRSAPEMRAVISAFNRMQERITALTRSRLELVGAFSHDVRTYATRLRLRAELIADEAERARAVRDIEDMIGLVNDALLAIQDKPSPGVLELVDVAQLVREEIEDHQRMGRRASFHASDAGKGALVLGNGRRLRQVFHNLIENAIFYGGEARAKVAVQGGRVGIGVEDSGPGIPREWRARVLQPFVRMEESRNRQTGGAGLGLAIAKNILEAHNGSLTIGDAANGGASIAVDLPLFAPVP